MKTLILNGSPRRNGDTVSLINELTEQLNGEYKIVDELDFFDKKSESKITYSNSWELKV